MSRDEEIFHAGAPRFSRRRMIALGATAISAASVAPLFGNARAAAKQKAHTKERAMNHKAYVYTEVPVATPFENVPWQRINEAIKPLPGFINKTWLSGVGDHSAGGFYVFDTIENAQKFVTGYFPQEAKSFGVSQTTRIFDAAATEEASRDMNSMHYNGKIDQRPGAFVYTEVQVHALPFNEAAPWRAFNPVLKQQPGLLAKTWTSGLHSGTPGGFYAFDTIDNALKFATDYFPTETAQMNAAYTTKVFDASVTVAASREMGSPFYA